MKAPAWLAELHRQWFAARGLSLQPAARAFCRKWPDLLDAAGLHGAAERNHAESEAKALEAQGRIRLRTHKYRPYLIEKVEVPLAGETWLAGLSGGTPAGELRRQSEDAIAAARLRGHPRWPESWASLCDRLANAFANGKNAVPFFWKDPGEARRMLDGIHALTAREWPAGTLVREASTALGLDDSKSLEERQRAWENALTLLFGEETTLESLGILGSQSRATLHGRLNLHFPDGSVQHFEHLRGEYTLSIDDLRRAARATTGAGRIFSIENAKTTFRQAAALNTDGEALLIATAHPNAATKRLLEILPAELPHHHFGDCDVSGYAILLSLRRIGRRPVTRFLMDWRDQPGSAPLSEHDRRLLPSLKSSPAMADCLPSLLAMETAGRKGRFEQEALGPPALARWPFWETLP